MVAAIKAPQLAMFFALQLMACSPSQNDSNKTDDVPPDMYSSTAEIYYLEPSERKAVEAKALEGDREAMDAIINHYELGGIEDNTGPLLHWLRLAYERGEESRLYDLVYLASDSDLECAEIVSLHNALEKLDPSAAKARRMGKVAECLNDRS